MSFTAEDAPVIDGLKTHLAQANARAHRLDAYYEGKQRLEALARTLPPELRLIPVIVNWPRLVVDSLEERLDVEGFRLAKSKDVDEDLWDVWQANCLDAESSLGMQEALVHGRSYTVAGFPDIEGGVPVVTVESSRHVYADIDPRTRDVTDAVRVIRDPDTHEEISITLYGRNRTAFYNNYGRGMQLTDEIKHNLGMNPVSPFVNRGRLHDRYGRSEMTDAMGLTDSACRALSVLQVAQDFMAVPARFALGATAADFKDRNGTNKTQWEAYVGRFLALGNSEAKVGQLAAADLSNFTSTVQQYASFLSGTYGLPPYYLAQLSDNPPSADGIRASESRWVKRAERRQRVFGAAWERTMRVCLLIQGRQVDRATRLETVWRDPSTPTYAAKADAVTKLYGGGILPLEAVWEDLGYGPEKRAHLRELMANDPITGTLNRLAQAPQPEPPASGSQTNEPAPVQ